MKLEEVKRLPNVLNENLKKKVRGWYISKEQEHA